MNQHFPHSRREPTQAAEGMPRWRWTLAEFERFIELGILTEDDHVELIGGEIVPMASKGIAHENVRADLNLWLVDHLPRSLGVYVELGWRPDADTYCEPDLLIMPRRFRTPSRVPPGEVLLAIEVADTTLKKDLGTKAALYAGLGVREYWVVNAFTLDTHVHLDPVGGAYAKKRKVAANRRLAATLVPEVGLRLADLDIASE
jgi:Uma2 family endonuclease